MARWTCPRCDREFGRTNQSHTCLPGNTVDATFRGRAPEQPAIYDAIFRYVSSLGEVHVDAVQVGVFLKSDRKFCDLRPKVRWLQCGIYLPYVIDDARIARSFRLSEHRCVSIMKLFTRDDVDEQLCAWLTEAFDHNTD
jgi:hypothetical protein